MNKSAFVRNLKRNWIFYALFVPIFVYYLLFHYKPLAGAVIAFKDYRFGDIWAAPWASTGGEIDLLKHFRRFLTNGEFERVFSNTVILAALRICVGFPAPIILALMLNELRNEKFKRVLQTVSYLPHFVSFVIVYAVMYNFFSYEGAINQFLGMFGQDPQLFLGNPDLYRGIFVFMDVWKGVGWSSIIYLAALSRVNMELYEAADLDGATRFQKIIYITLAELRPLISMQLILTMGSLFSVSLNQTMVMMNRMVAPVAEVISYYVYNVGLAASNQFSYGTAVGLFNSMLSLILVLTTNWISKKIDEEGGLW